MTDSARRPIQGAVATLPAGKTSIQAVTNALGQVYFKNIPSGVPSVSISMEGYAGTSIRAGVAGGRTFRAATVLRPLSETRPPEPFAPVITSVPEGGILRPGDRKELKFIVENRGGVGGSALCSVNIPDVPSRSAEITLEPGESKEVGLSVEVPADAPCDLELKLIPGGLENPTAVIRWSWDGRD